MIIRLICEVPMLGVDEDIKDAYQTNISRKFEDAMNKAFPRSEGYRTKTKTEAVERLYETFPEGQMAR